METQTKNIYNLSSAEVMQKFSSNLEGLSDGETQKRLLEFGKNKIEKKQSWKYIFPMKHNRAWPLPPGPLITGGSKR